MPRSPALEGEKLEKAVQMKKNGASYGEIAEEFAVSRGAVYNNVKPMLGAESESEQENERENERAGVESETPERLSGSKFRKSLELFIEGMDCEEIAEQLNVPQAAVEYELLPYVNELMTTRKLQEKVEELVS